MIEKYKLKRMRTPADYPVATIAKIENGRCNLYNNDETRIVCSGYGSHWVLNYPEFWEKIKEEPLFYTNEDEVYLDGVKTPIYNTNIDLYVVYSDLSGGTHSTNIARYIKNCIFTIVDNKIKSKFGTGFVKLFLTQKAAQDYVKLQKAIKASGLKVGDQFPANRETVYRSSSWKEGDWRLWPSCYKIDGFCIEEDSVCAYYKTNLLNKTIFYFKLDDITKLKLLFGDKEVSIEVMDLNHGQRRVFIECQNERSSYEEVKKFRDAISTIQNFKFGSKSINLNPLGNKFTIGCTTGTLDQIDIILRECEKLLKK